MASPFSGTSPFSATSSSSGTSLFSRPTPAAHSIPTNCARFHARLAASHGSGYNCDVKITCRGHTFEAMKSVLCLQSEVLEKMFGELKEVKEGSIELSDEDPDTVQKLLEFCHRFTYSSIPGTSSGMVRHMRLYLVAEKYLIPELQEIALKNFRTECLARWALPDFAEAIEEAYLRSNNPTVRKVIQVVALAAHDAMVANRKRQEPFWNATVQVPEFARDMLLALSLPRHMPFGRRYLCPACSEILHLSLGPNGSHEHYCKTVGLLAQVPNTSTASKILTEYNAQELFLNANGNMRGGLAHGFEIDEMPSYKPFGARSDASAYGTPGVRPSLLGSYPSEKRQKLLSE